MLVSKKAWFLIFLIPFFSEAKYFEFHHNPNHPILSPKFQSEVDRLTNSKLRAHNTFQLLVNPGPSLAKKIEMIQEAQEIVLVSSFIIAGWGDDLIDEFMTALSQKAKEKIPVYFIIDSLQSIVGMNLISRLERNGVKIAYYNTTLIPDNIPFNSRNHEKYVIVDFKKAVVGGQNIMNKLYPALFVNSMYWRDTDIYVEGSIAQDMSTRFLELWERLNHKDKSLPRFFDERDEFLEVEEIESYVEENFLPQLGQGRFLYNEGAQGEKNISEYYLKAIEVAEDIIVWQGNFIDLPDRFVRALIDAGNRGVQVILVTNSTSSSWWTPRPYYLYAILNGYMDFEDSLVEIRTYQTQFNHSKMFYVDGVLASVGSCNHDYMSLEEDTEGTLITYNKETVKQVYDLLQIDLEDTHVFDPTPYETYRIYKKYVPIFPYPLQNKFARGLDSRRSLCHPCEDRDLDSRLRGNDSIGAVFLNGYKLNDDVYIVIGMKNTVSDTATLLGRAGHHFSKMMIQTPENLINAFDSQVMMGENIIVDVGKNTYGAYRFMKESIQNMGETLEIQGIAGTPKVLAQGVIALAGSSAYLGLKLPAEIVLDVVQNLGRTSFALLRHPVRGAVKLVLAPVVAAYGTANTLLGTTIPLAGTLWNHTSFNNSEFLDDLTNPGLKFRDD